MLAVQLLCLFRFAADHLPEVGDGLKEPKTEMSIRAWAGFIKDFAHLNATKNLLVLANRRLAMHEVQHLPADVMPDS